MRKPVDVTGERHGMVVAVCRIGSLAGETNWLCVCDCGKTTIVTLQHFRIARSCGCLRRNFDITGQRFGRLVAERLVEQNPRRWLCLCDCGETSVVLQNALRAGQRRSCGCGTGVPLDLTGQTLGAIHVLKRLNPWQYNLNSYCEARRYLCECACGVRFEATQNEIAKSVFSCGCRKMSKRRRGGEAKADLFDMSTVEHKRAEAIWAQLNHGAWRRESDIEVNDAWLDYRTFFEDMGPPPHGSKLTRLDPEQGFHPWNCRWATSTR